MAHTKHMIKIFKTLEGLVSGVYVSYDGKLWITEGTIEAKLGIAVIQELFHFNITMLSNLKSQVT